MSAGWVILNQGKGMAPLFATVLEGAKPGIVHWGHERETALSFARASDASRFIRLMQLEGCRVEPLADPSAAVRWKGVEGTGLPVASENMIKLRAPLGDFAGAMELKLRRNDHKPNWRTTPLEALRRMMEAEILEYRNAYDFEGVAAARMELVDVANFCLILWDKLSLCRDEPGPDGHPVIVNGAKPGVEQKFSALAPHEASSPVVSFQD